MTEDKNKQEPGDDNIIKTYIRGFDVQIGGGIPRSHVVILKGQPGTMKSTLAYNLLFQNAKQMKTPGLYITLEQSRESLIRQMGSVGIIANSVQDKNIMKNGAPIYGMNELRERFESLSEKGVWAEDFKKILTNIRDKYPFDLLVIDSLYIVEMLARFEDKRRDMYHFIDWFRKQGLTVILISEDNPGDAPENYLCDGLIALSLVQLPSGDVQRRIQCLKLRERNHSAAPHTLMASLGKFQITKAVSN